MFVGCSREKDLSLVGKWTSTATQISRWDAALVPASEVRIYEFHEDGGGSMRYKDQDYLFKWSTKHFGLTVRFFSNELKGQTFKYDYQIKEGDLNLLDRQGETVIYSRR